MYYLNRKLIERLPKLLRVPKKELCSWLGIDSRQYNRWIEGGYMSVKMLERLANTVRISLSEFIVVHETPVQKPSADSYVISPEVWKDVKWSGKAFHKLLGERGTLRITKALAAERIDIPSPQYFDCWAERDSGMDVSILIRFLNEFKLDASLFFSDPNGSIPVPLWEEDGVPIVAKLKSEIQQGRQAEIRIRESERRLSNYREENARLKKEITRLKKKIETLENPVAAGMLAGAPVSYRSTARTEWRFHKELWQSLPSMFEMSVSDFCKRFGIPQVSTFILVDNIQVRLLVEVCNELRMSVSSFFLRKEDLPVVHDRGWYEVSKMSFKPIVSHMERMEYLFGKWSVLKLSKEELGNRSGVGYRKSLSMNDNERARVMTLTDVCSEFDLSPMLFFEDHNKKTVDFFTGRNEKLILNSIEMMKEIRSLREKIRKKENSDEE